MDDWLDGWHDENLSEHRNMERGHGQRKQKGKRRGQSRHEYKCKTLCIKGETGKESIGWTISTLNEAIYMMRLCRSQFCKPGLELKSMTAGAKVPKQRWSSWLFELAQQKITGLSRQCICCLQRQWWTCTRATYKPWCSWLEHAVYVQHCW